MVSPAQKKQAVAYVFGHGFCSERRACRYLGVPRSTFRYPVKLPQPHQVQLHQRIVALSRHYPRYGYRRIRAVLEREGWSVSRKQVQRIRRKEGLKVRPKPQRIPRQGISTGLPTQATHRNHVGPEAHPVRQWPRVCGQGGAIMAGKTGCANAVYRAGQPLGERLHRKLQSVSSE